MRPGICATIAGGLLVAVSITGNPQSTKFDQVIRKTARIVREQYVIPELGARVADSIIKKLSDGAYSDISSSDDLATRLSEDLKRISGDSHIRVVHDPELVKRRRAREAARPDKEALAREREEDVRESRLDSFGVRGAAILEGQIGYLQLRDFDGNIVEEPTFLANIMDMFIATDAIIVDLRRNVGGNIEAVSHYMGYFLGPEAVQYGMRHEPWKGIEEPVVSSADVPGTRHFSKPLYILTSGLTFSAAEAFSYHLQKMGRATIVGERTFGGGNIWYVVVLDDDFVLRIPRTRSTNIVTGDYFKEGEGVAPDIPSPYTVALETAHLAAIDRLMAETSDPDRHSELGWNRRVVQARLDPPVLTAADVKRFDGQYGDFSFKSDGSTLMISSRGKPYSPLRPLTPTIFLDDRSVPEQFEFVLDQGTVTGLRVHRPSGGLSEVPKARR